MTKNVPMFVFMSPKEDKFRRMRDDCIDDPKWFAYPIKNAGFELHFKPKPRAGLPKIYRLLKNTQELCALIFNISEFEALACTLFGHRLRICSLFQWKALENLPFHKRLCYRKVLDMSKVITVYDEVSEYYVRKIYPRKHIIRIGIFVDTEFFRPSENSKCKDDYILCPGSNFRLEEVVVEVARQLPFRVVRYSNELIVKEFYSKHSNTGVDFRYNVPYTEVRSLLDKAQFVLNIADDTQIPAGIYAFGQALAMNQTVVTPDMHSSAGYELPGGVKPYHTIDNPFDVNKWVSISKAIIEGKLTINGKPRDLAEKFCSLERSIMDWKRIKETLLMHEVQ